MNNEHPSSDLTRGPIFGALLSLAMPIVASSFISTAYNITDMLWISRLGSAAVAGIGSAGMYLWFSHGIYMLARMGGQVLCAQMIGRQNREAAQDYAVAAVRLAALLGAVFAAVCFFASEPMIAVFSLQDDSAAADAQLYLRITGSMSVFPFVNQVMTGLFTAQGDSRTPLVANTAGLVMNMLLDPLLILGAAGLPGLKAGGAALATVTAQVCSSLLFWLFYRRSLRRGGLMMFRRGRMEKDIYRQIVSIGLPSALQSCLYCSFSMVLTRLAAGFGSAAVAVQKLGGQIETVTWSAADGFGAAMNAFTAQNYGARKFERIRKGYGAALLSVIALGAAVSAVFIFGAHGIASLFFFEEEAIDGFVSYLVIVGAAEAFMAVELMGMGAISGFGETKKCSLVSIVLTGCRVPLAVYLTKKAGLDGIWWALSVTTVCKGIAMAVLFRLVLRRKQR